MSSKSFGNTLNREIVIKIEPNVDVTDRVWKAATIDVKQIDQSLLG